MIKNTINKLVCLGLFCLSAPALAAFPVALTDNVSMHVKERASGLRIDVLGNDDGTGLLVSKVNAWTEKGGRVFINDFGTTNKNKRGAPNVIYYPPANFTGTDTFWYDIEDNEGRKNAAKVNVTVKPENSRFPNPIPDIVSVQKNKSLRINVLKNDIFRGTKGEISRFNVWSTNGGRIVRDVNAINGASDLSSDQLIYTPPADFTGTDEFWYVIKTQPDFAEYVEYATKVTITVTEDNRAGRYPVAKEDFHVAASNCNRGYCPRDDNNNFFVTINDIGKNLKLSSNRYTERGGTVRVYQSNKAKGPYIEYRPGSAAIDAGEDRLWYVIEDEVGRKNWGIVNITITFM